MSMHDAAADLMNRSKFTTCGVDMETPKALSLMCIKPAKNQAQYWNIRVIWKQLTLEYMQSSGNLGSLKQLRLNFELN